MASLTRNEARLLLRNKFVVVLGDSIQRTVYKDLVLFLQTDNCLTVAQLRSKGEQTFQGDQLVEGGKRSNGMDYREARQYRSKFHLLRFYFLTRIYSNYVESVLADFQVGPQPDVLILNSCLWDISRYGPSSTSQYKENLDKLFSRLGEVLLPECLVIWNMAMPLGEKLKGGFLIPELQHLDASLRGDVIEANFYSAVLANAHGFDVLDLHYHFRFQLQHRAQDGIHWNKVVHRTITNMLLVHIAEAWGVVLPHEAAQASVRLGFMPRDGPIAASGVCVPFCHRETPDSHNSNTVETDFISDFTETRFGAPCTGYTSFDINPTCNANRVPYRRDLAPPQADRQDRGPPQTGGPSDRYWGLRSNNLVMRRRPRWDPAPYSRLPPYRLGHY